MRTWIVDMARIELPYVQRVRKRRADGTTAAYFYFRRGKFRVPLPNDPLSPAFVQRYQELASEKPVSASAPDKGTFEALIREYKASPQFTDLSQASKREYARYLEEIRLVWGQRPVRALKRQHVKGLQKRWAERPSAANYLIRVLKLLLSFAVDSGYRTDNPVLRLRLFKTGEGHKVWSTVAIEQFRSIHAAGTPMRTAFELGLGTGQRESDILKAAWSDWDGKSMRVVQQKTGTKLSIPCPNVLASYLRRLEPKSPLILTSSKGRGFKPDHFRHQFKNALTAAGLADQQLTFHGLRHTAAKELADAGCTPMQIAAITGHKSLSMVNRYTQQRDQERLAAQAVAKRERLKNKNCKPGV